METNKVPLNSQQSESAFCDSWGSFVLLDWRRFFFIYMQYSSPGIKRLTDAPQLQLRVALATALVWLFDLLIVNLEQYIHGLLDKSVCKRTFRIINPCETFQI